MKLPKFTALDDDLIALLGQNDCFAVAEVMDQGAPFAFSCPLLYSPDGKVLLLGLEQERTQSGRGLVDALWFDRTVALWIAGRGEAYYLTLRPWQCHITGERFRQALDMFRRTRPKGDLSVVWELYLQSWKRTEHTPPEPRTPTLLAEAEVHLELLRPDARN